MWKHLLRMLNWILLNRWRRKGVARGSAPQKTWCKTAGEPLARARVRACVACRCSRLLVLARFGPAALASELDHDEISWDRRYI